MDPITQFVAGWKIPIGQWGRSFFDFLTTNFGWFFDSLADGLSSILGGLVDLLPDAAAHSCWCWPSPHSPTR